MKPAKVSTDFFAGRYGLLSGVWFNTYQFTDDDHLFRFSDACQHMYFMLNGVIYRVSEDPDDGYRSHLDDIVICDLMPLNIWQPGERVYCAHVTRDSGRWHNLGETKEEDYAYRNDRCDIVEVWSSETEKVVLEFGTDMVDDYYPTFVGRFNPEHMSLNNPKADMLKEH